MKINAKTRIYGLVGWPIRHTLSPAMHNAAFSKVGIDAIYLTFPVRQGYLASAFDGLASMGVSGLNVTVPHKENVMKLLDKVSPTAALIGAVNTVVIDEKGMSGYNTDGAGFIASLKKERLNIKGLSILILGAGGAARAIGVELAKNGAGKVIFLDVAKDKAKRLASHIRNNFSRCNTEGLTFTQAVLKRNIVDAQMLINATPVGLKKSDPLLIRPETLHKDIVAVYDLIYNPAQTRLLATAKKKGIRAFNGLGMLLYQGAASFEIWTNVKAPVDTMKRALEGAIRCT